MTGTNFSSWYRQDEGTVFLRARSRKAVSLISIAASATPTQNRILITSSNTYTYAIQAGGSFGAQYDDSSFVDNVSALTAYGFAANNVNWAFNGTAKTLDSSVTIPTVNSLYFGADSAGAATASSTAIARFAFYPVRLADAQLQNLTAS